MAEAGTLAPEARDWVAIATGASVVRAERLVGGSSRESWLVDVRGPDGDERSLVLRRETGGGPLSGTELSLEREAVVYRALAETGIPVPRVHGVTDNGDAVLLDRVEGIADFTAIDDATEREAVATDFVAVLGALHSLDTTGLDLPGFPVPQRPEDRALLDLALWERIFDQRVRRPEPLARFAIRWLREHAPTEPGPTVLVHGDAGPGNFLFANGRVTAVLDWEFSHLGDPMDDWAWVLMRDHLQPFGDLRRHLRRYSELSEIAIDPGRILYYRAMVLVRTMIACLVALDAADAAMDPAPYLTSFPMFSRLLVQTLGELTGTAIERADIPDVPEPPDAVSTTLARDLAGVVLPAIDDPVVGRRAQGLVALALHLTARERLGPALEAAELDDLADLLGARPSTTATGWAAVETLVRDRGGDDRVLATLARRSDRQMALWAPALGPLAEKPFAAVPWP